MSRRSISHHSNRRRPDRHCPTYYAGNIYNKKLLCFELRYHEIYLLVRIALRKQAPIITASTSTTNNHIFFKKKTEYIDDEPVKRVSARMVLASEACCIDTPTLIKTNRRFTTEISNRNRNDTRTMLAPVQSASSNIAIHLFYCQ